MNVGIYNPYLDTLGGGERYVLTIASALSRRWNVTVFWNDPDILSQAQERFALDLTKVRVYRDIWRDTNLLTRVRLSRRYDAMIFLSDGSIPISLAKKNIIHFQFPVPWVDGKSFWVQRKLQTFAHVVCNSHFVKTYIDRTFDIDSDVIYPGVDTHAFQAGKKEKIIVSVGRFTRDMNTKAHGVMIDVFERVSQTLDGSWKLILAGAVRDEDIEELARLRRKIKTDAVQIQTNISFTALQSLYARASIYWHAAGYGSDLGVHPERAEHFGISVVEAMAAGCIPVVFDGGGTAETVQHAVSGFRWKTLEELAQYTKKLSMSSHKQMRDAAIKRSSMFDIDNSVDAFERILTV